MKKILFLLLVLFALPAQGDELRNVILTNGIGELEVPVDNVTINLGINTRDKDISAAKEENQKKYEAILEVITKKFGLEKDVIKSNFVSINPSYVPCYPTPERPIPKCNPTEINYYEANRSIEIKLDNLEKYDALIAALSEAGASYVNTGQYDVNNKQKYKDEARDLAIDAAKSKAEKIAKKLEVKLGKPVRFESYDDATNYRAIPMMAKMANAEAAYGSAPTDTATMGKIKISVTVNIVYQIE